MLKRAVNAQLHALRSQNWGQFGGLLHRIKVWAALNASVNRERRSIKTIEAITASPNSGVNTLTGEGRTEVLTITEDEAAQVERANASSATPVVFVHGLWLLPSSVAIRSYERVSSFAAAVFMFLNFLSELNDVTT